MKLRRLKFLNLCFAIALLLSVFAAGCESSNNKPASGTPASSGSQEAANSGPTPGGKLKIIMLDNTVNIGFPARDAQLTSYYNSPALERLAVYDKEGKMRPLLAESWESDPAKKTITIKLKQGIKFHDGTDFNAEAVKWNIEQFQEAKRPEVRGIQSMDIVDPYTLRINLEKWDSTLFDSIAWFVQMVSPEAVKKNGKDWAILHPVGTGPFTFVSWERDVSIKFKKNENYWQKGKPYLDSIEYALIFDRNTALNTFKSGGADVLTQMTPEAYLELKQSGKYASQSIDGVFGRAGSGFMFSSGNPNSPLKNLKVRQAIQHAVDVKALVDSLQRGLADATNQWYTPDSLYYNPDVKGYPYDPDKAKQLLAEAGYPNGFKTKIYTYAGMAKEATAVQSYLAQVGIQADVEQLDIARLIELTFGIWDGMTAFIWPMQPNAPVLIDKNFNKDSGSFAKNIVHPERLVQQMAIAKEATDNETKKKAVLEMQKVLFDENAMFFPMYSPKRAVFLKPEVQDLGFFKTNSFDWAPENVWIKK
jgi:peptide/nickel transport system substrate-binding protein